MADHTFVIYKMEVKAAHGVAIEVPLRNWRHDLPAMADAITEQDRLLFICNPNNPTGTMSAKAEIERLHGACARPRDGGVRRSLL